MQIAPTFEKNEIKEICRLAKVSRTTFWRYRTNRFNLTYKNVLRIEKAIDKLKSSEDDKSNNQPD